MTEHQNQNRDESELMVGWWELQMEQHQNCFGHLSMARSAGVIYINKILPL